MQGLENFVRYILNVALPAVAEAEIMKSPFIKDVDGYWMAKIRALAFIGGLSMTAIKTDDHSLDFWVQKIKQEPIQIFGFDF